MFDKKWFIKHQKKLLWLLNTPLIRIWFRWVLRINGKRSSVGKNKIVKILPNAIFWKGKKKNEYVAEFRTHDKFSKRLVHAFYPIWYLVHLWDALIANNFQPAWNLGFDTLTVYPAAGDNAPVDGFVGRHTGTGSETLSVIRSGSGTESSTSNATGSILLRASSTTNQFRELTRVIFCFDTSSLGSSAIIGEAILSLYGQDKGTSMGSGGWEYDIVASTPASVSTLVNSDYANLGSTVFASITYGNFSTAGYNNFNLDSNGIANIDKITANNTKFGGRSSWDTDNSFGGSWVDSGLTYNDVYLADNAGTSQDPKLVVTFLRMGGSFLFNFI